MQHHTGPEAEPPSSGEVLDFMRLVWAVDNGLHAVSGKMAAAFRVTGIERLVLRVLTQYPAVCMAELGEILGMKRTALAGPIRGLEEAGFVERKADPEDRRKTILQLTRRGARVSESEAKTVESAVRKVLSQATGRTVDSAKFVLNALATELDPDLVRARPKA